MVHLNQSDLSFQCQQDLTIMLCGFSTFCYYISATAFNISLVPQLHKNAYLKSTKGLSSLWAAALFTAGLVHSFFIFHINGSIIYFKISTVIYSCGAFGVLCQFWMYSKKNVQFKVTLFGVCMVIWIALCSVELAVPQPEAAGKLEWIAIVLFSVELLPQVMLNILEQSTLGQSNIAVVLMTVGKTFQFVPMQILETSVKFKSMVYVGAFLGHFNCLQLVWYRKPLPKKVRARNYGTGRVQEESIEEPENSIEFQRRFSFSRNESEDVVAQSDSKKSRAKKWACLEPIERMAVWQILVGLFEIGALVTVTVITTSYIGFQWILFVPCVLILILIGTTLYRDYAGASCKCWEDTLDTMHYKLFGETTM